MSREKFLKRIRRALYPDHETQHSHGEDLDIDKDLEGLMDRTISIQEHANTNWEKLFDALKTSSEAAGWKV
ncbi:MAG: hypothetical protein VX692_06260, partial [Chloroflexota bacterium]|nr:hypothetical protein [Chloroflexota bacterium]